MERVQRVADYGAYATRADQDQLQYTDTNQRERERERERDLMMRRMVVVWISVLIYERESSSVPEHSTDLSTQPPRSRQCLMMPQQTHTDSTISSRSLLVVPRYWSGSRPERTHSPTTHSLPLLQTLPIELRRHSPRRSLAIAAPARPPSGSTPPSSCPSIFLPSLVHHHHHHHYHPLLWP